MKSRYSQVRKDESRTSVIEYGLIAALIGIGILAAATALGGAISGT